MPAHPVAGCQHGARPQHASVSRETGSLMRHLYRSIHLEKPEAISVDAQSLDDCRKL